MNDRLKRKKSGDPTQDGARVTFRLFIAGGEPHSSLALTNMRDICRRHGARCCSLEVIDVLDDPGPAMAEGIVAAPSLVLRVDGHKLYFCGDLGDCTAVLAAISTEGLSGARRAVEAGIPEPTGQESLLYSLAAGRVDAVISAGRICLLRLKVREDAERTVLEELERRVQKRTVELVMTNEALREEIAERKRSEEEQRQSESRFRGLFENSPFAVMKVDLSGVRKILESSPEYMPELGAPPRFRPSWVNEILSEIILIEANRAAILLFEAGSFEHFKDSISSIFLDETIGPLLCTLNELYRGEVLAEVETQAATLERQRLELLVKMYVSPGCREDWSRVVVSFIDQTEQKKAERKLRRSQARLAEAQHLAQIGSWEWLVVENSLHWSDTLYEIFGIPLGQEMTYELFLNCVHEEDREKVNRAVREAFKKERKYSIEHRIVLPSGERKIIHEQAEVRFDSVGRPVRMIGTAQDVTQLKMAEQKLVAEREKLQQMLKYQSLQAQAATILNMRKSFPDAVEEVLEKVCTGLEINSACFFRIEGESGEVATLYRHYRIDPGMPVCKCLEYPDYSREVLESVKRERTYCLTVNEPDGKAKLKRLFGDEHRSLLSCPLSVGDEVNGFICFGRRQERDWDTTEVEVLRTICEMIAGAWERDQQFQARLDAEKKHTGAVRMAEQASRLASIGVLAGGITHEINQPLNAMSLATDSLIVDVENSGSPSGEELLGHLRTIAGQIRRIGDIITHMRTVWVSPESAQSVRFDLNDPLENALNLVRTRLQEHSIRLEFERCSTYLPILGNPIHLEQVVLNLVSNSLHALDEIDIEDKYICVRSSLVRDDALLEVEDNGPGFREDDKEKLFDPFYSTRRPGEGSGLGLAIVRKFVLEFGGKITAANNRNGGASFRLKFPLCESDN